MAVRDEIRQQREKLKGQGFKAHLEYFWEYYKIHTIVAVIVIIFIVTLARDISNNRPYALYAMFINNMGPATSDFIEEDYAKYASVNTDELAVLIDTSGNFIGSTMDTTAVATSEKIMAVTASKELDVIVSDLTPFGHYASQEIFMDLRNILSSEELESLESKDCIFYVDRGYVDYLTSDAYTDYLTTGKFDTDNKYAVMADEYNQTFIYPDVPVSEMDDPIPVGVILKGSKVLEDCSSYPNTDAIAGIVINTSRPEAAKSFLEYLLK